jgi:hypothetical protein
MLRALESSLKGSIDDIVKSMSSLKFWAVSGLFILGAIVLYRTP